MATHLAGVSDVIPGLLPWQPDLNFYRSALQYKEQQFEQGYQKVNSIYNSIFNSPLSREDNTLRRDEIFKKLDLDLKKAAKTDLSKRENIEAASKIFTPILKDKYLVKDIAFTKTYFNELNKAEAIKNCVGKNCPDEYWEEGVEALNYHVEDFQNASLEQTLNIANPRYTPYHNIYKEAIEYAKEMGFEMDIEPFLTPDGRYRVKMTNGVYAVPYFQNFLLNTFSNKPEFQEVASTQAYVNRKRFAKSNAEQYGGEENAEIEYMKNILSSVSQRFKKEQEELARREQVAVGQTKVLEEVNSRSKNQKFSSDLSGAIQQTADGVGVIKQAKNYAEETLKMLNGTSIDPSNLNLVRQRVDGAVSNAYLYDQLDQAAFDYANLTQKIDIEADPYALANYNHSLRMKEMMFKQQLENEAEQQKQDELNSPPPIHSVTGVEVDANAGQFDRDVNVNDLLMNDFNMTSGQAAAIVAKGTEEIFNILNKKLQQEKDPSKKAYIENKIREIYGITDEQPITKKLDGRETTELMARSWYQYVNSLPQDARKEFIDDKLWGQTQLFDGSLESFVRAVMEVSNQTGGITLFDSDLKAFVKDMQDMARGFRTEGADWDAKGISRRGYGSGWGFDKKVFADISSIYHAHLAQNTIQQGKGWVVRDNKGNLKFNKKAMVAADALDIQDDSLNPLNPINVYKRANDTLMSEDAPGLFASNSLYSDFIDRVHNPSYAAFKTAIENRKIIKDAQRNNNITVVDALATGISGMSTPELWSEYGEFFLTESGDVVDEKTFIEKAFKNYMSNVEIPRLPFGVTYGAPNPKKDLKNTYENLSEEFYEAFRKGLPGISYESLRLPYEATGAGSIFANGRMFAYDGRYLKADGDNATKSFLNFAESGELKRTLENGSTRFYSGDIGTTISTDNFSEEDQELLKGSVLQLMNDVVFDKTGNLKTPAEQRPKFTYSLFDISEGDVDRRAMTITFDQNFAKKLKDVSKDGEESAYARVFGDGNFSVTMTFPKPFGEELYAPITTPDYTKILNLRGGEPMEVYSDAYGGRIEAKKLPTGSYQIDSYGYTFNFDESSNKWRSVVNTQPQVTTVAKGYDVARYIDNLRKTFINAALRSSAELMNTPLVQQDGTE